MKFGLKLYSTDISLIPEARLFADEFGLDSIIVHGGNNGSFEETIRQLGLLQAYNDVFAIIKEVLVKGNLKAWLKTYPLVLFFKIR